MTICKNCGKDIVKLSGRWYHTDRKYDTKSQRWYCSTKKAEPTGEEVQTMVENKDYFCPVTNKMQAECKAGCKHYDYGECDHEDFNG